MLLSLFIGAKISVHTVDQVLGQYFTIEKSHHYQVHIPYPRERGPTTEYRCPPLWAQFPAKV